MSKVAIVGPKDQLPATVDVLHELNLLHIEDFTPGEAGFELGSPLAEGSKVSERLVRLRGVLKAAQFEPPQGARPFSSQNLGALEQDLADVERELSHLVEQRTQLADEEKRLDEETSALARIRNLGMPVELLRGYTSIAVLTGFVPEGADLSGLRTVHPDLELETSQEAEGLFVAAFVPRTAERTLQDALSKLQFQPVDLPPSKGTAADRLARLEEERSRLASKIGDLESKMANIRDRHAAAFYALDESLAIASEKATSPVRFRTTRNSFMIEGWVPSDAFPRLEAALVASTRGLVFLAQLPQEAPGHAHGEGHDEHAAEAKEPPVMLRNPRTAAPYELLTDTYSRPKFTEVDPTLFFTIGFPFFYAFMLGDVGYGALLLVLVWAGAFTKLFKLFGFQSTWHLNRIFLHSSLLSILFGILYGEFFGIEFMGPSQRLDHHTGLMVDTHVWIEFEGKFAGLTVPLSRFHEVKPLLFITLAIAAIHMLIGLLLGLRNATVQHGFKAAVKHRGGWFLVMLAASIALVVGLPGVLQDPHLDDEILDAWAVSNPTPFFGAAGLFFALGVIILLIGEGGIALLELPTVISNLLSYTRLAAIGLSGAGIALAGNKMAELIMGPAPLSNPGGLIAGVLILLVFHGLNVGLGVLGPAIHSLRLHYVEFFTKFYEGGGEPYAPFGATRRYTTKEVKQA